MIRVVLVDDHMLVREGIRTILEHSPEIEVVGEAACAQHALHLVVESAPDVVICDLQIPGVSGAELVGQLVSSSPRSAVLILSAFLNPQLLRQCLSVGARGYLLKDTETLDIVSAVRAVASGGTVFDSRVSRLENDILDTTQQLFESLSPKELQVCGLLCRGLTNNEIAAELGITLNTIKTHVKTIMRKLDCRNRVEIVSRARELNLV